MSLDPETGQVLRVQALFNVCSGAELALFWSFSPFPLPLSGDKDHDRGLRLRGTRRDGYCYQSLSSCPSSPPQDAKAKAHGMFLKHPGNCLLKYQWSIWHTDVNNDNTQKHLLASCFMSLCDNIQAHGVILQTPSFMSVVFNSFWRKQRFMFEFMMWTLASLCIFSGVCIFTAIKVTISLDPGKEALTVRGFVLVCEVSLFLNVWPQPNHLLNSCKSRSLFLPLSMCVLRFSMRTQTPRRWSWTGSPNPSWLGLSASDLSHGRMELLYASNFTAVKSRVSKPHTTQLSLNLHTIQCFITP